jgi:hypothetical protein
MKEATCAQTIRDASDENEKAGLLIRTWMHLCNFCTGN